MTDPSRRWLSAPDWLVSILVGLILAFRCAEPSRRPPATVPNHAPSVTRSIQAAQPAVDAKPRVHVRGYYRKDGTYFRPHERRWPRPSRGPGDDVRDRREDERDEAHPGRQDED